MTKEEILKRLKNVDKIFGYMYGSRYIDDTERIISISKDSLNICKDGLIHIWGWPGPDYSFYEYIDYGETWAFSKEELGKRRR